MAYSDARGLGRLVQAADLLRYKLRNRDVFADVKHRGFERIRALLEAELGALGGKTLLEIGCGQWQTNVRLLEALGADVVAVDPELPPASALGYPAFAREVGAQRAAKTALNELFFRRAFERRLEALSGLRLGARRARLFRRGAEHLPCGDGSLDGAFSDDVFEHLPDVAAVTREVARALRPGAPLVVIIHPFAALSGGHHPDTIRHEGDSRAPGLPPWDHLRRHQHPSGVYCNGVRADRYRQVFEAHLETVSWEPEGPEGEALLTDEILAELPGYGRDELLTGKIVYVGRKRAG